MRIGLQTWGSEGDVQPFLALASGLALAGHEVTLAVSDNAGRDYSGYAERFGFRLVKVTAPGQMSIESLDAVFRQIVESGNPLAQAELIMKHAFDPLLEPMWEAANALVRANDAVIGHFFVYPLQIAAEKAGVPRATVNLAHSCVPSAEKNPAGFPDLGRWSYPLAWKLVRAMLNRIFLPRVNALRRRAGLAPERDAMTQSWASPVLNLVAVSPTVCPPPADWRGKHEVCGFLNLPAAPIDEPPLGLDDFLAGGPPPVYFTFGSMTIPKLDYVRAMFDLWNETVRRVGCRAIFQLPWDDLSIFKTDERVFKAHRSPHTTVFPKCALVVHHGGAGTTQASLLAGRASVVVAHLADQFFWGTELERLGVAGRTRKRARVTPEALARSIRQVLSSTGIAATALTIGAAMSRENGVGIAIRLIEERLPLPPRTA